MSVEINQIPITATSITSGSFFPLDLATGGSPAYETRKATLNTLANEVLDEQLTGDRFLNINGNVLNLYGGQVSIGTPLATNYALEVNDSAFAGGGYFTASGLCLRSVSSTGLGGQFEGVSGVAAYSQSGNAILGQAQSGGLGGKFEGGAYVETYGFGGSAEASAVFEAASTTKGALIPRMTTTQRDAISSPATGLYIYNTTTGRFEFYNGTYWRGFTMRFHPIQFSSWSPTDGQTVAFGSHPFIPVQASISPAPFEIVMRGNGVIRGCDLNTYSSGVAGSNEAWSLYVRHNGTDYLVQTLSLATGNRVFTNQSLNIPFVDGDIVRMILVNPTWGTNPTNVAAAGSLNIQ